MFRFFENLVDPYQSYTEADEPPRKLWPFLWTYTAPFRGIFVIAAVLSVIVAGVELVLIWAMGWVVDILAKGPAAVWEEHGVALIALAVFILILRPLFQALDVLILNNAMMPQLATVVRWRAHRHVMRQSVGWFENDFAGRIANRIMQTPSAANEAMFQIFDALTYALAYVLGSLVLLGVADPWLMVPLALWLGLYAALMTWVVRKIRVASRNSSNARSQLTGRIVDSYTNIHSIKMFAHHGRELEYGREAIEHARSTFQKEMRLYTIMDVALAVLNGLLIVAVTGLALWSWGLGLATVGTVAAATALTLRINAMTGWIMWALTNFFQQLGIVQEGMETIAQPVTLTDRADAGPLKLREGAIDLEGVTHHYGRGQGGLDSIDLKIAPGEKVGLVGRSGAGKSTLVKLLMRFYDIEGGRILVDGQDISQVTQESLRARIGMVQQDSALLHRSVRDNILYGRPDASEADMIAAARQAQAHDFILDLEDSNGRCGYEAHVGERGVKLSGGQRQRIALARVILKDAPILILDEATSALDSEVEAAIQDTLYGMMEGKTVIAIAHRLSTIAHMDRILVMDAGRIVEQGNHAGLLERGGLYAGFWSRQSGGFLSFDDASDDNEAAE
ncbi:ATP-binding cassette, subfamily B, multidrug efflux pump [Roseivivax halotolerans]|uniref:ATP-binding cassette, subfamily B, multidrug efflux pump n=1 Tax=Roseivivax halotolerans TaxID=93684 RepID=A0A1I5VB07_9RHOB|nr:ABC transporter ATP-binding protein [Roseivivax halotolerans]SFQ04116.1 ATP-binding cassette, subfamily B, multidrug efflux pump [Roseivivax halotolerans]